MTVLSIAKSLGQRSLGRLLASAILDLVGYLFANFYIKCCHQHLSVKYWDYKTFVIPMLNY